MNYDQTLAYLYAQLPMYQRLGKAAFKKDLTNIVLLCEALGNPQERFNSIHVAGTNGKGSVSSMLNSILMEQGYKTGLYTSPHLKSFTERIRVQGQEVPEAFIVEFVARHQALLTRIAPSFFEVTVAMAFEYFAQQAIDIAVIEVGLGGRLDSTNIIHPLLSIITNISLDHQSMLGNTLEEIAGEKAGIIKANIPVVIGERQAETDPVFIQSAKKQGAGIHFAENEIAAKTLSESWQGQEVEIQGLQEGQRTRFSLGLAGTFQTKNLQTCLMAVKQLRILGWEINQEALQAGIKKVRQNSGLRGRMEVLRQEPLILMDTGHNVAGVKQIVDQLMAIPHHSLHIVWGMVSDKDHEEVLALLPKEAKYYFVKPQVPRGLDARLLQKKAAAFTLKGDCFESVQAAIEQMQKDAGPGSLGFVGGSTFVIAEVEF